jgi:hypothetical protein
VLLLLSEGLALVPASIQVSFLLLSRSRVFGYLQACWLLHQGSPMGVSHQLHHGWRWPGRLVSGGDCSSIGSNMTLNHKGMAQCAACCIAAMPVDVHPCS